MFFEMRDFKFKRIGANTTALHLRLSDLSREWQLLAPILENGKLAGLESLRLSSIDSAAHRESFKLPEVLFSLSNLRELEIHNIPLAFIPPAISNLSCLVRLVLSNTQLRKIPDALFGLTTLRDLCLPDNQLTRLPPEISNLAQLTGLWLDRNQLRELPNTLSKLEALHTLLVGGNPLVALPNHLHVKTLDIRDCTQLTHLPKFLRVERDLELGNTNLEPPKQTVKLYRLRWNGVTINEQAAFSPDTLTPREVFRQRNAEVRRVMIQRMGLERFIAQAQPTILDSDADTGGARSLLRIDMRRDEAITCLAVSCPSTGRQYMLRVPPEMTTCQQAAAWIAGFDDPNDYRPIMET